MRLELHGGEFDEWLAAFRSSVKSLPIGRRAKNAVIRGARSAYLTPVRPSFSNDAGDLLDFNAWCQAILAGNLYPKISEIYGLGRGGISELILALGGKTEAKKGGGMLWNDKQIRFAADWGMIDPYAPEQVRRVDGAPVISFGVSSFGYDMRLGDTFQIFRPVQDFPQKPGDRLGPVILDPKAFDGRVAETVRGATCIIPPHGFALAYSLERFAIPRNVLGVCLGKSTYARIGVVVGITPLEPGWCGNVTIEMSNTTDLPVKVYANEGIAQVLFLEGEAPVTSYADRSGKYQNQPADIVWAKV